MQLKTIFSGAALAAATLVGPLAATPATARTTVYLGIGTAYPGYDDYDRRDHDRDHARWERERYWAWQRRHAAWRGDDDGWDRDDWRGPRRCWTQWQWDRDGDERYPVRYCR